MTFDAADAQAGEVSQDPARRDQGQRQRGNTLRSATSACKSLEGGWLAPRRSRRAASPRPTSIRGEGRLYIRVFPHKSVTSIPAETRMGKGKGEPEYWAAVVKPGMILFEIGGLPEAAARDCLARVAYKMPFKCRFVRRPTSDRSAGDRRRASSDERPERIPRR